jgi:glycosyltransferase involved in cell wall biosynthesis
LRVLHIIDTLRGGGAEASVCDLLPRLRRAGVETAVIAGSESRLNDEEKSLLLSEVIEGGKCGKLDWHYGFRLSRMIREQQPDIVHTHTFHGKYWGRMCAVATGIRIIVHTEHSSVVRIPPHEMVLTSWLARHTRAVVTFSERTRELVQNREPVPEVVVIPNGVDTCPLPTDEERARARAALGASKEQLLLGMIASLVPNKNQRLVIDAVAALPPALRERTILHFFGTGPLEADLREQTAKLGLAERVVFHGFYPALRDMLPALDLVVNVSLAESAPISLLEAMNNAIPIVGAPNSGVLDLIGDGRGGIVLSDYSVNELSTALERALSDPGWRKRAGRSGRAIVLDRYDISSVVQQHLSMYRRLIAG